MDGEIKFGTGENAHKEYEKLKKLAIDQGVLVDFDDDTMFLRTNGTIQLG